MFTVEMEHDATVITTMDQRDEFEDVECIISDDGVVFMRQWNEGANNHDLLYLSFQQLTDLFIGLGLMINELGQGFLGGIFLMYVLALPLLYHMVEPEDEEEDNRGPIKFAFMWPVVAMEIIYSILVGEKDDDGTGTS
jgi:hypothetical protein